MANNLLNKVKKRKKKLSVNGLIEICRNILVNFVNSLSANPAKWATTLEQSIGCCRHTYTIRRQQPTNCLSVFDHFMGLVLKGLTIKELHEEADRKY